MERELRLCDGELPNTTKVIYKEEVRYETGEYLTIDLNMDSLPGAKIDIEQIDADLIKVFGTNAPLFKDINEISYALAIIFLNFGVARKILDIEFRQPKTCYSEVRYHRDTLEYYRRMTCEADGFKTISFTYSAENGMSFNQHNYVKDPKNWEKQDEDGITLATKFNARFAEELKNVAYLASINGNSKDLQDGYVSEIMKLLFEKNEG